MFTRALADLAEDSETRGRLEEAAAWYQYGVERAPVSESLYRGLIRCCLRQGETAAAASAYRRCEKMLSTILNVSPSHKTRELAATFLRTG